MIMPLLALHHKLYIFTCSCFSSSSCFQAFVNIIPHISHQTSAPTSISPKIQSTLQEIIPTRPRMRNQPLRRATPREHHPIGPWAAPRIRLKTMQDRKLVVRAVGGEVEAFVVVVHVRVVARADLLVRLQVGAAFADGGVDGGLVVAGGAAGFDALALGGGRVSGDAGETWGEGLLTFSMRALRGRGKGRGGGRARVMLPRVKRSRA